MAVSGLSGGCGVTTSAGKQKASASCDLTGSDRGCVSNASGRGDDGTKTVAAARCEGKVSGCAQHSVVTPEGGDSACRTNGGKCTTRAAGPFQGAAADERTRTVASCTGECEVDSTADRNGAESGCATDAGRCYSRSNDLDQDAFGVGNGPKGAGEQGGSARAVCDAANGCGTATEVGRGEDGKGVEAVADIDCGGAVCTGRASTLTDAGRKVWVSPEALKRWAAAASNGVQEEFGRPGSAAEAGALCTVSASGCRATSTSDSNGAEAGGSAEVDFDCERAGCIGNAVTRTAGSVHGVDLDAVRKAGDRTTCKVTDGGCEVGSGTEVDRTVQLRPTGPGGTMVPTARLSAASTSDTQLECERESCVGSAKSTTRGAASGDVRGVRGSAGKSSCNAEGAGAECATTAKTVVEDRDPAEAREAGLAVVSGPVSVSQAGVSVDCDGGDSSCRVAGYAGTSARDTGVTPHGRGTSADLECTVSGGDCGGQATSASSSAADHVVLDPRTGKPLARQPRTGPSSTSSSEGYLRCDAGTRCSGSVRTSSSAWDGAVNGGKPRTSQGDPASCTGVSGGCEARSVSTASSGRGASLALAADPAEVNTKRLPVGPSAASASGAAMSCEGERVCTGTVRSGASAIDPSVSEKPRGSYSTGSCKGVRGGQCVAVTNSGSSTGPDANVIAPLMDQRSTENATITEGATGEQTPAGEQGSQQPGTPPAPSAPGSSANSGGPTVPGASSWTMADAVLDCTGSTRCSGQVNTSAWATDGPTAGNDGNGARGPPIRSSDTEGCWTSRSDCVAQAGSVAGSGQVVADMIAEQRDETSEQLAEQATQARKAAKKAARVAAQDGATAKQKKAAKRAQAAARELRKAAREAAKEAAKPVYLADIVTEQLEAAAEQAAANAVEARKAAAKKAKIAARNGATETQKKAAKKAKAAARSAREAARDAAELAKTPVRGATAAMAEATGSAQCSGPGCVAWSNGDTSGKVGDNPTGARCRAAADGCAVASNSSAMFSRYSSAGEHRSLGSGQSSSQVDCPDAACNGWVKGAPTVEYGPEARHLRSGARGFARCAGTAGCQVGITAATYVETADDDRVDGGTARGGSASATVGIDCAEGRCVGKLTGSSGAVGGPDGRRSRSQARGLALCKVGTNCQAQLTASSSVRAGRTEKTKTEDASRFATTNASVTAVCGNGTKRGCATRTWSKTHAMGNADGAVRGVATSRCGAFGACASGTGGYTEKNAAQVSATCQGVKCRTKTVGPATGDGLGGKALATCQAGKVGGCATTIQVARSDAGVQAVASCRGGKGATCRYGARTKARSMDPGATASAFGVCRGTGSGQCATSASALTTADGQAQAAASCTGSARADCRYGYAAASDAESVTGGNEASAGARCGERSGTGSGWCGTNAFAETELEPGNRGGVVRRQQGRDVPLPGQRVTRVRPARSRTPSGPAAGPPARGLRPGRHVGPERRRGRAGRRVVHRERRGVVQPPLGGDGVGLRVAPVGLVGVRVRARRGRRRDGRERRMGVRRRTGRRPLGECSGGLLQPGALRQGLRGATSSSPRSGSVSATWEAPYRKWSQYKNGTCSGTTGDGCGVHQNGSDVGCFGDCANLSVISWQGDLRERRHCPSASRPRSMQRRRPAARAPRSAIWARSGKAPRPAGR